MDERQSLVESFPGDAYSHLVEKARPLQSYPLGPPAQDEKPKRKRWWPF